MDSEINRILLEQIKKQQELLDKSILTIDTITKGFQKLVKLVVIVNAIALTVILSVFFWDYFHTDFSNEIREKNSNYNYNENINKNINSK